jgi:signal transduction histidine kinase
VRVRLARLARRALALPARWWTRQSLRARLTLIATALFAVAVATGAVLVLTLQRFALIHILDSTAHKNARDIARQVANGNYPRTLEPTTGGVYAIQVVDAHGGVHAATQGVSVQTNPWIKPGQLSEVRSGRTLEIPSPTSNAELRVLGRPVGRKTVLVYTDVTRVDDSVQLLARAALIGGPIAVILMGAATYFVVALTLRPVAELRHGAADITAAELAEQRLPVPSAQDEIHRLALTLNAMLDRIDSATSRQRTFVGDAAHELRSPLASVRLQLEVGQRLGPEADWKGLLDDVLVDVARLERLVDDLLMLARIDEAATATRREPVDLGRLTDTVVAGYVHARVPVTVATTPVTVQGDPDALRRVIVNLVDNAVRHAEGGVSVTLQPGERKLGRVAVLSVVDDGPGIPESERARVFDRFYRLHESRSRETGGTGLGLPIVRDIVRNHGGRVRLTDRIDGAPGLRAVVLLPLGAAEPVRPVEPTERSAARS